MVRKTGVGFLLSLVFVLFAYSSAVAETYVGGGLGVAFSADISEVRASTAIITDLESDDVFAYGLKVGHYFNSMPWLGVEVNAGSSTPDIDNQSATVSGTAAGIAGATVARVEAEVEHFTTIGFLIMLRPTKEQTKELYNSLELSFLPLIEPYLGIGFARNSINLSEAASYTGAGALAGKSNLGSGTEVGILLSLGLNHKINDRVKFFGEYKYTESSYDMTTETVNYEFDVEDFSLMFGASYSF